MWRGGDTASGCKLCSVAEKPGCCYLQSSCAQVPPLVPSFHNPGNFQQTVQGLSWAPDIEPGLGWPADGLDSRSRLAGLARSPAHAVMQSCTGCCCCWWSHECEAGAGVWWRLSSVLCTHRPPLSSGHDPAAAARPALTM